MIFPSPYYHSSDDFVNTSVIHRSDEIDDMEKLGDRLKRLRNAAGLTQAELAADVGLSQGTIGNIEANIRGYGQSLASISRRLAVSTEYLNCETDSAPSSSADQPQRSTAVARAVALGNQAAHGKPVPIEKMVLALRQILDELMDEIDDPTRQAASTLLSAYASDPKKNAASIRTLALLLRASFEAKPSEDDEDPDPDDDGPGGQPATTEDDLDSESLIGSSTSHLTELVRTPVRSPVKRRKIR